MGADRIVFSDIDGTFLTPEHQVTAATALFPSTAKNMSLQEVPTAVTAARAVMLSLRSMTISLTLLISDIRKNMLQKKVRTAALRIPTEEAQTIWSSKCREVLL